MLCNVLTTQSLLSFYHHMFDFLFPLLPPYTLFPSGNHQTVVCVSEFFVCLLCSLVAFCLISQRGVKSYNFLPFPWLISLSMVLSRSIHVVADGSVSSFLIAELSSIVYDIYQVCPEKVQPLLTLQQFAPHWCHLASKESGLECTCVNNDNLTVLVSGGGRHHWVNMYTVWLCIQNEW